MFDKGTAASGQHTQRVRFSGFVSSLFTFLDENNKVPRGREASERDRFDNSQLISVLVSLSSRQGWRCVGTASPGTEKLLLGLDRRACD